LLEIGAGGGVPTHRAELICATEQQRNASGLNGERRVVCGERASASERPSSGSCRSSSVSVPGSISVPVPVPVAIAVRPGVGGRRSRWSGEHRRLGQLPSLLLELRGDAGPLPRCSCCR
jgi:hypothetical protein